MDLSRYAALFLADARENLRRSSDQLVEWEARPDAGQPLDELFRAFHSLKGSAATMGYRDVEQLAHASEGLLEAVRSRQLAPSKAVAAVLFQVVDLLERSLDRVVRGEPIGDAGDLIEAAQRLAASATPSTVGAASAPLPGSTTSPATDRRAGRARVDPARLDELLQQAGELVVARNRLMEIASEKADPELEQVANRIDNLTRSLHGGVLRVRLAPVSELFGRFPRIVRDLAQSLGKLARLEVRADGIELDRSVLEELVDPLVHLVRNAVDHGLESPVERIAGAKPPEGHLLLTAERKRDRVVIRLSDDGRGIDRGVVLRRAAEVGALVEGSEDLLAILARPGFTLKREVTELSGRGVGMDIVATRLRALGGSVQLITEVGRGTAFTLTVPLTTAVQRVVLVGAGSGRFAIPFRMVREATRLGDDAGATLHQGGFSFRGRPMPYRDLRSAGGGSEATRTAASRHPVLILDVDEPGAAIGVDSLLGQHDVLLERLEAPETLPAWVSGATILGDGAPAFVVDPTALF